MTSESIISHAAVLVLGAVLGFICGRACNKPVEPSTTTEVRVDTLFVDKPVETASYRFGSIPLAVFVHDTLVVADTLRVRDTLYVNLPREVREYRDSTYACAVSGYQPRLDWIETYGKVETRILTQPVKRWSIGIQGGVGVVQPFGGQMNAGAYIGIGISYKLW